MVLAIAKGFGFSELIENKLAASPIGQSEFLPTVIDMVQRYLDTGASGAIIGIGIIILISAVYSFFRSVETSFNEIWNVKQSRSLPRQAANYIAVLFLIPVLIIVTIGLNIYLHSAAVNWEFFSFLSRFRDGGLNFLQFVVATIVFMWMYMAIPNTKVRFIAGLIPGLVTAVLLMAIEALSVYVVSMELHFNHPLITF